MFPDFLNTHFKTGRDPRASKKAGRPLESSLFQMDSVKEGQFRGAVQRFPELAKLMESGRKRA